MHMEDDKPDDAPAGGKTKPEGPGALASGAVPVPEREGGGDAEEPSEKADAAPDIEEGGETAPKEEGEAEETNGESGDDAEEDETALALPLASVVEAILFAAREPLKLAQIARAVGRRTRQEAVKEAIEELNLHYLETTRAFEIAEISGRLQLMSRPEYAPHIMRLYPKRETGEKDKSAKLSPAALDTLAIIAYKQLVTRGEIERIRGVGCGPVLRALIERGTVKVAGKRADLVGQPLVYGTTEAFLAEFGLGSLDELPLRNEFLGAFDREEAAIADAPPESAPDKPDETAAE